MKETYKAVGIDTIKIYTSGGLGLCRGPPTLMPRLINGASGTSGQVVLRVEIVLY